MLKYYDIMCDIIYILYFDDNRMYKLHTRNVEAEIQNVTYNVDIMYSRYNIMLSIINRMFNLFDIINI